MKLTMQERVLLIYPNARCYVRIIRKNQCIYIILNDIEGYDAIFFSNELNKLGCYCNSEDMAWYSAYNNIKKKHQTINRRLEK